MRIGVWSFSQNFSVRVSTMLLFSVPTLALLYRAAEYLPAHMAEYTLAFSGALLSQYVPILAVLASIFAFAFFMASVIKRNPQAQFVIELVAGFAVIFLTPVY